MEKGNSTNLYRELIKYPQLVDFLHSSEDLHYLFDVLPHLSEERKMVYKELYSKVGNTPVTTILLPNDNKLFVKRECDNGMGNNHYSRYWIIHLALAESLGLIKRGDTTILEISSGSSGISLSMACKELDYKLKIIIPENLPKGRVDAMNRDCTTIIKVPGYLGNCREFFLQEKDKADYYIPNHSEEKADLISFVFSRVAYEFISKYGTVDNVVLGLGNGSSSYSIGKVFKKDNSACKIYSFYPSTNNGKIVFGLYADNLTFRHINLIQREKLVEKEFYIDDISLDSVYDIFSNYPIVKDWGCSSLFALFFASRIVEGKSNKSVFSVAYDKINRYYE